MSAFAAAYTAHTAGRLAEAERGYRDTLAGEPGNADAWHLLGVLAQQLGRSEEAVDAIGRAVGIAGPQPAYLSNLGIALQALNRHEEALTALNKALAGEASFTTLFALGNSLRALRRLAEAETRYREAAVFQPENAAVQNNLGSVLQDAGRLEEASAAYRRAIALNPAYARAHYNLGLILKNSGDRHGAELHLGKAAALDPGIVEAKIHLGILTEDERALEEAATHMRQRLARAPQDAADRAILALALSERGMLHKRRGDVPQAVVLMEEAVNIRPEDVVVRNNLANALLGVERAPDAELHLRAALASAPSMPETHFHLGNALKAQDRLAEAVAAYEAALTLRPGFFKARINLAGVLRRLGEDPRALATYEAGINVDPSIADLWSGRGVALQALGRHDDALASFERARELNPNLAEAHRNAGVALLMQGDYARGWESYDWRWKCEGLDKTVCAFPLPLWQGERDPGGVVLWGEQGLGDKVLYAGMIPDLMAQGHPVVFATDPRLFTLFERSFPGLKAVPRDTPPHPATAAPDMRWQAPLAGLGRWLRADANAFPPRPSYLKPDPARQKAFRTQLESMGRKGPIVGISWASTNPKIGRHKTLALKNWASILTQPDVHFVDLQYGETAGERAEVEAALGMKLTHIDGLDLRDDIDGLTALASACDLVIAVSTTTVHLAAAAGVPTLVLIPAAAGNLWYWGRSGERTPWYPNARIIRQDKPHDWDAALAETARRLTAFRA